MASEEAALRAKIQAMKNLLQAKQVQQQQQSSYHAHRPPHGAHYAQRTFPTRSYHAPVNRSWNRFANENTSTASANGNTSTTVYNAAPSYYGSVASANKVWRKEDADGAAKSVSGAAGTAHQPSTIATKIWKRPLKVAASRHKYQSLLVKRARNRMQLQVLKLEDGDYAKANGGFSLIRAGVKSQKSTAAVASALKLRAVAARLPNSVNIGGAKYVVTRRGNSLKRWTGEETTKSTAVAKQPSALSLSASSTSTTSRAQAAVLRARHARLKKKNAVQNKMPVCALFLRGACTRDDCKYRHVKVSRSAQVCQAFLKGFCADGEACRLKHELPPKKQPAAAAAVSSQGKFAASLKQVEMSEREPPASEQENQSPHGLRATDTGASTPAEPASSSSNGGGGLSIRPNILFRPKNASGFPSLFSARSALSK